MTLIDRYVLRQFAVNFAILTVVVQGLFVSIDLIVNLEAYLGVARKLAEVRGIGQAAAFFSVVGDFYAPMCILMYVYLSGIVAAAAMGFTIVHLQRTRELTAVVASGISLRRVAMAFAAAGLAANLLASPVQEWILPRIAYKALRSRNDLAETDRTGDPIRYMRVSERGDLLLASGFNLNTGTMTGFHLLERSADGRRLRDVVAPKAVWDEAQRAWVFSPAAEATGPGGGAGLGAEPETVAAWPTGFSPSVIHACRDSRYACLLSMGEMEAFSRLPTLSPDLRSALKRAWWGRIAMPLFGMLLSLVPLTGLMSRMPVMTLRQGMNAAGLTLGCWGAGLLLMLGQLLPPFAAALLPVAGLAAVVAWRLKKMET